MSNTIKDIEETINWLEDRKWTLVEQDMERAKHEQIEKESREMYAFSVIPEARGGSVRGYGSMKRKKMLLLKLRKQPESRKTLTRTPLYR